MAAAESTKSHASKRTAEEWVNWAHSLGHKDICVNARCEPGQVHHFSFPVAASPFCQVYCNLCNVQVVAKADNIKKHCEGYKTGPKEERVFKESIHAQRAKSRDERQKQDVQHVVAPAALTQIVVNVLPEKKEEHKEAEPPAKKARQTGTLDTFMSGVKDRETFLKDVTTAFAGLPKKCNQQCDDLLLQGATCRWKN